MSTTRSMWQRFKSASKRVYPAIAYGLSDGINVAKPLYRACLAGIGLVVNHLYQSDSDVKDNYIADSAYTVTIVCCASLALSSFMVIYKRSHAGFDPQEDEQRRTCGLYALNIVGVSGKSMATTYSLYSLSARFLNPLRGGAIGTGVITSVFGIGNYLYYMKLASPGSCFKNRKIITLFTIFSYAISNPALYLQNFVDAENAFLNRCGIKNNYLANEVLPWTVGIVFVILTTATNLGSSKEIVHFNVDEDPSALFSCLSWWSKSSAARWPKASASYKATATGYAMHDRLFTWFRHNEPGALAPTLLLAPGNLMAQHLLSSTVNQSAVARIGINGSAGHINYVPELLEGEYGNLGSEVNNATLTSTSATLSLLPVHLSR